MNTIASRKRRSGSEEEPTGAKQVAISSYFKKIDRDPNPVPSELPNVMEDKDIPPSYKGRRMQVDSDSDDVHMENVEGDQTLARDLPNGSLLEKYKNINSIGVDIGAKTRTMKDIAFENKFSLLEARKDGAQEGTSREARMSNNQPTQLEQQYLSIKGQYKDCILLTEVGYKYRFFGDDALIAAKELNIVAYFDHTMYTASIPTHRLGVHTRRLVQCGYKIGIIQQMETAALKASGSNKAGPFERKLTKIYTRGTFIEEFGNSGGEGSDSGGGPGYILYMRDMVLGKARSKLSIVAVSPSIGDIVYDEFEDDYSYEGLNTRLHHIMPVEIVVSEERISKRTLEHIRMHFSVSPIDGLPVRIEVDNRSYNTAGCDARSYVVKEYERILHDQSESVDKVGNYLNEKIILLNNLPDGVVECVSALLKHLSGFGLSQVAILAKDYTPFLSMSRMTLNSDILNSLELYDITSRTQKTKSLISILDRTSTPMGKRTLRKWLLNPLILPKKIHERHDAVEEISLKYNTLEVKSIKTLLSSLPDLEKSACRIFYTRCCPSDLYSTLSSFEKLCSGIPTDFFNSQLLKCAVANITSISGTVNSLMAVMDSQVAAKNETIDLFTDNKSNTEIAECKKGLSDTLFLLDEHLKDVARQVRIKPSYISVAGVSHLIEVPLTQAPKVPVNWIKINQTKSMARFHTPLIIEKLKALEVYRELLQAISNDVYRKFLRSISENIVVFREVTSSVGLLDCAISLAYSALSLNYVRPQISEKLEIEAISSRNPIIELCVDAYTHNDISINANNRVLLITGPNMGGKSSYIRQIALLILMAQMGSFVPAKHARVGIFDSILMRMGASDDIAKGQSTFMKELTETSNILRSATERSLVIIDELGRGTSTHDGTAIAHSTLTYFITELKCMTLFISHFTSLGELKNTFPNGLHCYHMSFIEDCSNSGRDAIVFLYKVVDGLARKSYGLNVARLAGLAPAIIERARILSGDMQSATERRVFRARLLRKIALARRLLLSGKGQSPVTTFY